MQMKRLKIGLTAVALCLGLCAGLTGCGENAIPEMTDDELDAIGEYAAFILMKYDASNRSRLVTLPPEKEPAITEPSVSEPPQATEEPSGMGPVDDVPVTDISQPEGQDSMEDVLGLADGLSVSYVDAWLCDNYPDTEAFGLMMSASAGKRLLVMRFCFLNRTEQEQQIDIASQKELSFRIAVNENERRNAKTSLLPDDMTMFQENVPAGESVEAVLIIETEQASMEEISSISLTLKNNELAHTIQLK